MLLFLMIINQRCEFNKTCWLDKLTSRAFIWLAQIYMDNQMKEYVYIYIMFYFQRYNYFFKSVQMF